MKTMVLQSDAASCAATAIVRLHHPWNESARLLLKAEAAAGQQRCISTRTSPACTLRAIISLCLSQTAAAAGHQPAAEGGYRRREAACLTSVVKAGAQQRSQTAQIVLCYLRQTRFTLPDCGQRARLRAVATFHAAQRLVSGARRCTRCFGDCPDAFWHNTASGVSCLRMHDLTPRPYT